MARSECAMAALFPAEPATDIRRLGWHVGSVPGGDIDSIGAVQVIRVQCKRRSLGRGYRHRPCVQPVSDGECVQDRVLRTGAVDALLMQAHDDITPLLQHQRPRRRIHG